MNAELTRGFNRVCLITLLAVYFLILVGAIVRTTGSGMGCPDWPKCYGGWMPPTRADQLPSNYKEMNAAMREKKNQKFVRYLRAFGLRETADRLEGDTSVLQESDFNVVKAWIEYINRLVGVAIGFLIALLFWKSLRFRKRQPRVFYFSAASLIAVIVQGWFGSIVVSTNLTTWTVTIHMFLALLIVAFLVYLYRLSEADGGLDAPAGIRWLIIGCMATLVAQVFLGTQVREMIDIVASSGSARSEWMQGMGVSFFIHRSFSLLVVFLHVILYVRLRKWGGNAASWLLAIVLTALVTGAGMAYFSVPPFLQPIHLVLATAGIGMQLLLLFRMSGVKSIQVS